MRLSRVFFCCALVIFAITLAHANGIQVGTTLPIVGISGPDSVSVSASETDVPLQVTVSVTGQQGFGNPTGIVDFLAFGSMGVTVTNTPVLSLILGPGLTSTAAGYILYTPDPSSFGPGNISIVGRYHGDQVYGAITSPALNVDVHIYHPPASPVAEPVSLMLLCAGTLGVLSRVRRKLLPH